MTDTKKDGINLERLKTVLALPTISRMESVVITWLVRYCDARGYRCVVDPAGNVYVTKGKPLSGVYPCVAAHTDSVHRPEEVQIMEKGERLIAVDSDMRQCGLGGDDKAGVYVCLELLERLDVLKAVFFASEEIGCVGSRSSDPDFFADVGYLIEFDSPCDDIMTVTCDGTPLFPTTGRFYEVLVQACQTFGVTKWQHHPYTDVSIIKRRHTFPCLNLPAGYFRMHTHQEYVKPAAVWKAVQMGEHLIRIYGNEAYVYVHDASDSPVDYAFDVTSLACHG